MRKEFSSYPGLRASVQDLSQQGFGGSKGYPVEFSVRGSDWNTLVALATKLKAESPSSGLVTDVDSDYQLGAPELVDHARPRARHRPRRLGQRHREHGERARRRRRRRPVLQRRPPHGHAPAPARDAAHAPRGPRRTLRVRTAGGTLVPLSSVVVTKEQAELQQINHADRERAITITGNVAPGHAQGEALAYVQTLADVAPRPATASCSAGRARSSATR